MRRGLKGEDGFVIVRSVVKIGYTVWIFSFSFFFLSFERKLDNVGKYLRAASMAITSALYLRLGFFYEIPWISINRAVRLLVFQTIVIRLLNNRVRIVLSRSSVIRGGIFFTSWENQF